MLNKKMREALVAEVGTNGNRWKKGGYDRLYFDPDFFGFEYTTYKTGNISSAHLDGKEISNAKGRQLLCAIKDTYIDLFTGDVHEGGYCILDLEGIVKEFMEKTLDGIEYEPDEQASSLKAEGYAALVGSEKQIDWAEEIRSKYHDCIRRHMLDHLDEFEALDMDDVAEKLKAKGLSMKEIVERINESQETYDKINKFVKDIKAITSAKWWIDNRDGLESFWHDADMKKLPERVAAQAEAEAEEKAVEERCSNDDAFHTLTPENKDKGVVATITISGDSVRLKSEYDEGIVDIMHTMGAKWSKPYWGIKITCFTGEATDRAAEMVYELLQAGYPVRLEDEEVEEKALNATFVPRKTRWIVAFTNDKDHIGIKWDEDDRKLYNEAKSLPGARWKRPCVVVPVSAWREIIDFADINGFEFGPGVQDLIDVYRANQVTVKVADRDEDPKSPDKLAEILKSDAEVLDDLKDED